MKNVFSIVALLALSLSSLACAGYVESPESSEEDIASTEQELVPNVVTSQPIGNSAPIPYPTPATAPDTKSSTKVSGITVVTTGTLSQSSGNEPGTLRQGTSTGSGSTPPSDPGNPYNVNVEGSSAACSNCGVR